MIKHRCKDHVINPNTEILIIGTFNPAIADNPADFFYGREQNNLWDFLEEALLGSKSSLKYSTKEKKIEFIRNHKIDFIDLISEIGEKPADYKDENLDKIVTKWRDIEAEATKLLKLRRACISRKTFKDVPNIGREADKLAVYFSKREIPFYKLHTPARARRRGYPEWQGFLRSV